MHNSKRIVITGIGPLSSLGVGKDENWQNAINGNIKVSKEDFFVEDEVLDTSFLYKILNFDFSELDIDNFILGEIKEWKKGDDAYDLYYLLCVIKLALIDSGLKYDSDKNDVSLVVSSESPGHGELYTKFLEYSYRNLIHDNAGYARLKKIDYYKKFFNEFSRTGYDLQTFMLLFHAAKAFSMHGYSLEINNACASGLYAVEVAADIIRSGKSSTVLIAAIDHPNVFKSLWFKQNKIYSEDGKIRPFCSNANGFVMGEGGAALVLEELNEALKRKAHIYAEYIGGAFSLESWKVTSPRVDLNYYKKTIINSLAITKLNAHDIDLVVPHGTGIKMIDRFEAQSISEVFNPEEATPLLTAFKPYVGHNLGGCTLLELSLALLCVNNNCVLPLLDFDEIDRRLGLNFVTQRVPCDVEFFMKTCSAFAGFNAALIFRKYC